MTIRTLIVDDEAPARDRVRRLLDEHDDVEVIGEAADADGAVERIDALRPDLCLLDVRMPGGDAFEVLERVDHLPHVVFTTAYDQYAVRAFEVRSLDYLMKPFSRVRLGQALDRARAAIAALPAPTDAGTRERLLRDLAPALQRTPPERITARRGGRVSWLAPESVLWFQAEDTLVVAVTAEGRWPVESSLAELETRLSGRFFRTHRAYLVQLDRLSGVVPTDSGSHQVVLDDGTRLPLSRRQARQLRELFSW